MTDMQLPPQDAEEIENIMSNFDHAVEGGIADKLKTGNYVSGYPARDFYGEVWWDGSHYNCAVTQYRAHVATVSAKTCQEIMKECCLKYGSR